ncbi:MAG: DUF4349 domain-containing protein [Lachnospiraceae bacterium]|nr:DUF4349 domain-containing protein [Lachnospiraceae bacterium]
MEKKLTARKKRISAYLVITCVLLQCLLTGCGSSSSAKEETSGARQYSYDDDVMAAAAMPGEDYYDYYEEPAMEEAANGIAASKGVMTDDSGAEQEIEAASDKRKLIKTVNMDVETESFDELVNNILNKINALGGYPENTSVNGSNYGSTSNRYAYITARIPAEKLDGFVEEIAGNSNVLSRNESIDDVTLNYVDMEAKKKSLQTEYDRLNKLIETAEDLETLILLEERLAEVRYELESYESRLRTIDNQVTYATVNISISEVVKYTPTPTHEESLWERMAGSFTESCEAMIEGLKNLLVVFVAALPFLILLAVIALIIILVIRFCIKKSQARAQKKAEERAKNRPAGYDPMTGKPIYNSDKKDTEGKKPEAEEKAKASENGNKDEGKV